MLGLPGGSYSHYLWSYREPYENSLLVYYLINRYRAQNPSPQFYNFVNFVVCAQKFVPEHTILRKRPRFVLLKYPVLAKKMRRDGFPFRRR